MNLEEIQALKNKLEPEIKGTIDPASISATDSFWEVGPTGTSRVDKFSLTFDDDFGTPIGVVGDFGITAAGVTPAEITALSAQLTTDLTADHAYTRKESTEGGFYTSFDTDPITGEVYWQEGNNNNVNERFDLTWESDSYLDFGFNIFNGQVGFVFNGFNPPIRLPLHVGRRVQTNPPPIITSKEFRFELTQGLGKSQVNKRSLSSETLIQFFEDNELLDENSSLDDKTALLDQLFTPPLEWGANTRLDTLGKLTAELANRAATLVKIVKASPSKDDIAKFSGFRTLLDQHIATLKALDTSVEEEIELKESNNRLFKKLEEIRDKLPPSLPSFPPLGEGETRPEDKTLLDYVSFAEQLDFKKKLIEWVEDQYGIESARSAEQGNNQKLLTEAITLGENLNDTNKTELKRFMFVFEEFYKSASAMLSTINRLIEKIASAIAR